MEAELDWMMDWRLDFRCCLVGVPAQQPSLLFSAASRLEFQEVPQQCLARRLNSSILHASFLFVF